MLGGGNTGKPGISDLRHPQYVLNQENWEKWRLTYLGGNRFLKRYLKKFSRREDDQDFVGRREISYVPAFAKSAINEVRNSIFQRMQDISRNDGPASYKAALSGQTGGVDLLGSAMNTFIGRDILPELLSMARVGVYVDMPPTSGTSTLAEKGIRRPYLYWYKAEDIRSWAMQDGSVGDPTEFKALLLRDSTYDIDEHWVLPYEVTTRYRYLWIDPSDGLVHCEFYKQDGDLIYPDGYESGQEIILPISRIPFVMFELSDSLLADTADYQISLMNLASSDMNFALKSNFPFYTEQWDQLSDTAYFKPPGPGGQVGTSQTSIDAVNASVIVNMEKTREARVGSASGRRYPKGLERPGFIAPPQDSMQTSMAKQQQMKSEIRELVLQAVSNLESARPGAENNQQMNMEGLASGLSYIGCELEHGERKIAGFWSMYEDVDPATINYPKQYSLLSEEDRREQAKDLKDLMPMVPSITFRRSVSKRIVNIVLGSKISESDLKKIEAEIDSDPVVLGDPAVIEQDVVNGLVDLETASAARGYPKGCVAKAKVEHAERLATIAEHQAKPNLAASSGGSSGDPAARGVKDASANTKAPVEEKTSSQVDQTKRGQVKDRTRGEGK